MFKSVLIANRGEIVIRVARTLRQLGIESIGIYSEADRYSGHVIAVDRAIELSGAPSGEIYLHGDLIIEIAKKEKAEAIFPGYGFLSENADFARDCESAGLCFIGPTSEQIYQLGLKHIAYELAFEANLPLLPHTGILSDLEEAKREASTIGYPVMLKSTAGSGGKGMTRCSNEEELINMFEKVRRAAIKFLKNDGVYLERCIDDARHIEIQIFGDGQGHIIGLSERDCSIQRRHQKIVEEAPAPGLSDNDRVYLRDAAIRLGSLIKYRSAGTVEFVYDRSSHEFYFLEVNCRLQVEHPVTESIFNIDLVEWMIILASSGKLPDTYYNLSSPTGVAIEVRLCSEDPLHDFRPSSGIIHEVKFPQENVRIDTWISNGTEITPYYDSLLAKMIVHGKNRQEAIEKMCSALNKTILLGIGTNLDFLRQVISSSNYFNDDISLKFLTEYFQYKPNAIEILEGGTYTTIQDYPGRTGYWHIGVPPSGPMDDYAFRIGNRLVGNNENACGLECTLIGPTIRFHQSTTIAITGGSMNAILDDISIDLWKPIRVEKGQILKLGKVINGCRCYISIRGGFDLPFYLGSRSTFVLGKFGGYAGRILKTGDILFLGKDSNNDDDEIPVSNDNIIPYYPNKDEEWQVAVLNGPHGSPDFFTSDYIKTFFSTSWKVHYNSNRLGIRLLGPKPIWSRTDGGDAGLHPSNIHDCEYAIGSINFTGDTPIILTCDGPSLGGFVCPVTIIKSELWKIGQIKPNDRIHFYPITFDQALQLEKQQDYLISTLSSSCPSPSKDLSIESSFECILEELDEIKTRPKVIYRQAGDHYILIEYGSMNLNLHNRFRIHFLMEKLENKSHKINGILELSPGVRSLQIKYDSRIIHQKDLLKKLIEIENDLPSNYKDLRIKSRIIYLPLTFEDSSTLDSVQRYKETVREIAPWLPNNVDFIQRINGLSSRDDVKKIVFDSSYLILGLGDVYLGAPCAIPIDPRHRLVTSKYNPARTFTAEGIVGIGGVYMCIYGMDSPGGYQLIGRSLPIWNTFTSNKSFKDKKPWLLRFFDQVRFYSVDENELLIQRQAFRDGRLQIRIIEDNEFDLNEYEEFLQNESESIKNFIEKRDQAFNKEVSHWKNDFEDKNDDDDSKVDEENNEIQDDDDDDGVTKLIRSDVCGNVWKLLVEENGEVKIDSPLIILEAMKMELVIRSPINGKIQSILCHLGQLITTDDILLKIKPL
ncbi:unnamed protein product [Adineta steineri]|uniref:Urea carboxylase n=1 Tax=Adineta steineri TaxID=433720 RepID=A0A813Z0N5_9BILA|nr:unnamed protein product [Adineta steineri]CAF3718099.1 unnamed protein product [Adineta steineri]